MANDENLKGHTFRDKPENINKKGRPKQFKGLTDTLRDLLNTDGSMTVTNVKEVDENGQETGNIFARARVHIPKKDAIILAAMKRSLSGDIRAVEFIFNRIEGKPTQPILLEDSLFGGYDPDKLKKAGNELRKAAESD